MQTKTSTESRGGRPVVTEHKVDSRSRPGLKHSVRLYHGKDGAYLGGVCSCEAFQFSGRECRHLRLVNAQPYTITAVHDSRVPGMRYDIHGPDGYEGRCISYSDAHDTIVHDLNGFVANYGGAA